jgi:hypothetical protein
MYGFSSLISCCRPNPRVRRVMSRICPLNLSSAFGLARNERLEARIAEALTEAQRMSAAKEGKSARAFRDFLWSTKES